MLKMEEEIFCDLKQNKDRSLERAMLFCLSLSEEDEEFLKSHNYSHEKMKKRLLEVAEKFGIADIVKAIYI